MANKEPRQLEGTKRFFRNFLRINDSREFLMFLFFLLIAFVIWYLTTMNNVYEMKYALKLQLKNLPETLMVTEPLPKEVEVVLKDKGDKLVEYKVRKKLPQLTIDHRQYPNIAGRTSIYGTELEKLLSAQLASSTQIVSISYDTLQYYAAEAQGVKLPVVVNGRIESDSQYAINGINVSPDSVMVYAAAAVLDTMKAVYTARAEYVGLKDSVSHNIKLVQKVRGMQLVPADVQLNVAVSPYVGKSVEVPVKGYLFPYGVSLKTFPSKATIAFQVAMDDFQRVTAEDFAIEIHYVDVKDNPSGKIALNLTEFPDYVRNIRIEPVEVDYLIEINALNLY